MTQHDACPKCDGPKRTKNRQCASCRGYGRGRHVMPSGYVRRWIPGHPLAMRDGYVLEHHVVLHEAGMEIPKGYHVHHRNGDKTDNRIENLEVLTPAAHVRGHIVETGHVVNQFGRFPLRHPKQCETCGAEFMGWTRRSRFCSRDCSNKRACAHIVGVL